MVNCLAPVLALALCCLVGCTGGPDTHAAISSIPTDVSCIRARQAGGAQFKDTAYGCRIRIARGPYGYKYLLLNLDGANDLLAEAARDHISDITLQGLQEQIDRGTPFRVERYAGDVFYNGRYVTAPVDAYIELSTGFWDIEPLDRYNTTKDWALRR